MDVSVWLAHCYLVLGELNAAKELFTKILEMTEQYISRLRTGKNILASLEHLVRMPVENEKEWETIKHQLKCELHRLAPIYESESNKEMAQELSDLTLTNERRLYKSNCSKTVVSSSVCLACKDLREFNIIDDEALASVHRTSRVLQHHESGTSVPHWAKYPDECPSDRPIKISDEGRYLFHELFDTKANGCQGHTISRHSNRVPTESDDETGNSVSMDDNKMPFTSNQSHLKPSHITLYSEQRKQAVEHSHEDRGSSKDCNTRTLCDENQEQCQTSERCLNGCHNKNAFQNVQIFARCDSLRCSNDHLHSKETNGTGIANITERQKEEVKNNNTFHEHNLSSKGQSGNTNFRCKNAQTLKYDSLDSNRNIHDSYVSQNSHSCSVSNEEMDSLLLRAKRLVNKYSPKDNLEL